MKCATFLVLCLCSCAVAGERHRVTASPCRGQALGQASPSRQTPRLAVLAYLHSLSRQKSLLAIAALRRCAAGSNRRGRQGRHGTGRRGRHSMGTRTSRAAGRPAACGMQAPPCTWQSRPPLQCRQFASPACVAAPARPGGGEGGGQSRSAHPGVRLGFPRAFLVRSKRQTLSRAGRAVGTLGLGCVSERRRESDSAAARPFRQASA